MSWVDDLGSSLGIPASAATAAVAMYAACAAAEKAARPEALREIGAVLNDPSWEHSARPPATIERIFVWTFGARHWTLECAFRSLIASFIFSTAFVILLVAEHDLRAQDLVEYFIRFPLRALLQFTVGAILPDFLALYKTRVLLRLVKRIGPGYLIILALIMLDILVSTAISVLATSSFMSSSMNLGVAIDMIQGAGMVPGDLKGQDLYKAVFAAFIPLYTASLNYGAACFYSTLLTSAWLVLTFLSVIVIRMLVPLQRFTAWFFDVENHPVQAVGIVAGVLVMVGSLLWSLGRKLT